MNIEQLVESPESRFVKRGQHGSVGLVALDRRGDDNTLTYEMVVALLAQLDLWESDPTVEQVVLFGRHEAGLCSGGDYVTVRDRLIQDKVAARHFSVEYELMGRMAEATKPWTVLMHGVTTGSGLALGQHGAHRLITPTTRGGINASKVGWFPDAGMRAVIARKMPGELGVYMALTGNIVSAADLLYAGLADMAVEADQYASIVAGLVQGAPMQDLLDDLEPASLPESHFIAMREFIDETFEGDDLAVILERLANSKHPEAARTLSTLRRRSPLSLMVTFGAIREVTSRTPLEFVLEEDADIMHALLDEPSDFSEAVRARIIDQDRDPSWLYTRVEDVPPAVITGILG